MNTERNPAERLGRLVGVNVTSIKSLREAFYHAASGNSPWPKRTHIHVAREVHDKYIQMYRLSRQLAEALYGVLEDGEHQLAMEEAAALGYNLPDFALFRDELDLYNAFLKDLKPFDVMPSPRASYVKISRQTAESLHHMMGYNCTMVGRIFSGVFDTDYMKRFTGLRQQGVKYAGTTALQETMNLLMAMAKTTAEIERQISAGRQRNDWPALVAG